jgi:hypothetical protein
VQVNIKAMNKKILAGLILISISFVLNAQPRKSPGTEKALRKGNGYHGRHKNQKGVYKVDAYQNADQPVILIEGYRVTVDFNNAILQGSNTKKDPDQFFGIAIIISSHSSNVTIKNLR